MGCRRRLASLAILIACIACSDSHTLTRARAKTIIETVPGWQAQNAELLLTEAEFAQLSQGGYIAITRGPLGSTFINLSQKGTQFFVRVSGSRVLAMKEDLKIVTRTPIRPMVLRITGITKGETDSDALVDFEWKWDTASLPGEVKPVFLNHPTISSKAVFRLYDDGWRFTDVKQ